MGWKDREQKYEVQTRTNFMQCDIISSEDLLATRLFIVVSHLHIFSMDKSHKDMYTKQMID